MTIQRNRFSTEFKVEVIHLVTEQNYSIRRAAEAMSVGKSTLDKWVRQYRQEKQGLTPEQLEIQQLKKQIKQLELEKDILKKASVLLGGGQLKKILMVKRLADNHSLRMLCDLFGITRSAYYYHAKPKTINTNRVELIAMIKQDFHLSKQSASARTIASIVTEMSGKKLTRYLAGKLMKQNGLISCQPIKHRYHQGNVHVRHDNLLDRQFTD